MRNFCLLLFLLSLHIASGQAMIKGVVIDDKGTPVSKASVFLNNTSIGTTADNEGQFSLRIPNGKFDLIVSSVGYLTHSQSILSTEVTAHLTIRLKEKAPELETVIIEPFEKDGWQKWGRWFTENFLGTSEYGRDSRLINPEVLRFRNSKKTSTLSVIATAPLTIENNALGYKITYQLENFQYNFKTGYLLYAGFPFFEYMQGSNRKQRKWEKEREAVYYGSMLQFMRAVYRNKILEEGFEVRRLRKIPNVEKQRIKLLYKNSFRVDESSRMSSSINKDSAAYYEQVMSQDDYKSVLEPTILPGDSIAYAVNSTVAGMYFEDYLLITYKNKKTPAEYKQRFPKSSDFPVSEITLVNNKSIDVFSNGSYYNPEDLLNSGYWGWWEKMGTMLPFDYEPLKQ